MSRHLRALLASAAIALLAAAPAQAQSTLPPVPSNSGGTAGSSSGSGSATLQVNGAAISAANPLPVFLGSGLAVIGSVLNITGTVSLPTGAATSALQQSILAALGSPFQTGGTVNLGTIGGAATAAKQPAPGVAGTPSTDVLSVQGVVGGTPQPADTVVRGTAADRGGTIAAGGTAQALMAANTARRGFVIQNQDASARLYFSALGTATQDYHSFMLNPGDTYVSETQYVGTGAISIIGPTTGQAFYAREF